MKKSKRRSRKQSPLLEIRKPIRIRVYQGEFTPFESTKYLDVTALKRAKSATIEVGTVEVAGLKQTVAAEISKGMVVALKPIACEGCNPKPKKKSKKYSRAELKKMMVRVRMELADRGINERPKPMPLRISPRLGFQIPIGPIIIVIGEPPLGIDLCFEWWDGNTLCWWCIFGPSGCITFG